MKEFIIDNMYLLIILAVWDTIWKLVSMYQAARADQKGWYIVLAVLNTLGILPIIYLYRIKNKIE
ncbi:MAG: DUF5652 family protein [Bacteroidales bacterium]